MNCYQLDSKEMDQDFLNGKRVTCQAVISEADLNAGNMQIGEKIVIMLSNRSKYMGRINDFRYTSENGYAKGFLEIIKA